MNNAESFVRILFHGLFIIARNTTPGEGNLRRWEIGLPPTKNTHELAIRLRTVNSAGLTVPQPPLETPALITVMPDRQVELQRAGAGEVNRLNDTGDVEHHQWIIDMEGPGYHDEPVVKKTGANYVHKLYVGGGTLFTYSKTVERYMRFNIPNVNVNYHGRFAAVVGIEIKRSEASVVTINDGTATPRILVPTGGSRHELICTHLPKSMNFVPLSHFPLYYEVLADSNDPVKTKYDLVHVDLNPPERTDGDDEHHAEAHDHAKDNDDKFLARRAVEPQVCNAVILGRKDNGLPS